MSTMTMQDYANLGAAALTGNPAHVHPLKGQALHARNESTNLQRLAAYAVPTQENRGIRNNATSIGWSTPSLSYDKMRQINGSALSLNFDIEKNVARQEFKDAWNTWFVAWQNFFNRYQSDTGKFGALFDTDAVAAQTESYRVQLIGNPDAKPKPSPGWVGAYEAETGKSSSAADIPPLSGSPGTGTLPNGQADPNAAPPTKDLPWWVVSLLVVGGVTVVAGTVFILRRKAIQAKQAEHFIKRDVLPLVLSSYAGPTGLALAHASANSQGNLAARDFSGRGEPTLIGRDFGPEYVGHDPGYGAGRAVFFTR